MKTFAYTARQPSGAMKRGTLVAPDRATALAQLKAQNLVPVSVEEGKAVPAASATDFDLKRITLLAFALAALAAGGWFVFRARSKPQPKPAPAPIQKRAAAPARQTPPAVIKPAVSPAEAPKPKEIVKPAPAPAAVPAEFPAIVPPKTNALALRMPAKTPRVLVPGIKRADTNAPNAYVTFRTKSEKVMSHMLLAKPGEPILGLGFGRDFDQDFIKALDNTIEIYSTDTPEEAAHKENVAWMKEEMRKLVAQGQKPEEILTAYREQHNEVVKFRTDLQRQLSALKAEGKVKEAEAFVQEANKLLEPYGTRPLALVPTLPQKKAEK